MRSSSAPPHCPRCTPPPILTRPAPSSGPHSPSSLILNPPFHGPIGRSNRHSISRGRLSTSRRIVNAPAPRFLTMRVASSGRCAHDTALRTSRDQCFTPPPGALYEWPTIRSVTRDLGTTASGGLSCCASKCQQRGRQRHHHRQTRPHPRDYAGCLICSREIP
jgi:hypothetical protein